MNIQDYEYLWTSEKEDWVLVMSSYGYGIVNKTKHSMLYISDEILENALISRMLEEGNKVYINITDAYKTDS